ncbi:MAG: hypothetical protein V4443_00660 [Pseudomonadota bacterium]
MKTEKDEDLKQKQNSGVKRHGWTLGEMIIGVWLGGFFLAAIVFTIWVIIRLLHTPG